MQLATVKPTLINCYNRRYYRSANGNYRITIDSEMEFYAINARQNFFLHQHVDLKNFVLELKYNQDNDEFAREISTLFPFRVTRSSKYIDGIERLIEF